MAALPDGNFVVVWWDHDNPPEDIAGGIKAQVFDASGNKIGAEFIPNTTRISAQSEPCVDVLADGRFVITWRQMTSFDGSDNSGSSVRGQIFDSRTKAIDLVGTDLGDSYVGTGFNDQIAGGKGHDSLIGGGGRDTLEGGPGLDRLQGGGGVDRLIGGKGKDILTGGDGSDAFVFRNSKEAKGDRITDFQSKMDDIDLSDFMKGGKFIGAKAFSKKDDQVRYDKAKGLLQGDVNGDGKADWSLTIVNKVALSAADFIF